MQHTENNLKCASNVLEIDFSEVHHRLGYGTTELPKENHKKVFTPRGVNKDVRYESGPPTTQLAG